MSKTHSRAVSDPGAPPVRPEAAGLESACGEPESRRPRFRRRNYLVDKRSQLVTVAMVGLLTAMLLVLINLGLYVARSWTTAEMVTHAPQLRRALDEQSQVEGRRVLIASGVMLLVIMAMTVLQTHRTAGAAYKLRLNLAELRKGKYGIRTVLRRGDKLRDMEREFNGLSQALLERSNQIAVELEDAAAAADRVSTPVEAHEIGDRLRRMAAQERLNRSV